MIVAHHKGKTLSGCSPQRMTTTTERSVDNSLKPRVGQTQVADHCVSYTFISTAFDSNKLRTHNCRVKLNKQLQET